MHALLPLSHKYTHTYPSLSVADSHLHVCTRTHALTYIDAHTDTRTHLLQCCGTCQSIVRSRSRHAPHTPWPPLRSHPAVLGWGRVFACDKLGALTCFEPRRVNSMPVPVSTLMLPPSPSCSLLHLTCRSSRAMQVPPTAPLTTPLTHALSSFRASVPHLLEAALCTTWAASATLCISCCTHLCLAHLLEAALRVAHCVGSSHLGPLLGCGLMHLWRSQICVANIIAIKIMLQS